MQNNFPKLSSFPSLLSLSKEFTNVEIFLVGGAVRDILLNKKMTDIDILVRNINGDDLEEFLASHGRVVFAGKNFGVWKFNEIGKPRDEIYDIALPRTEFSMHKQGIYQDFKIKTNPHLPIEKDLQRRDFTINAMAYNLATQKIIDPHQGQKDLKAGIIKSVGKPEERFQEDYSRILRGLRFSLQLNFKIEKQTFKTIKQMMQNINNKIEGKRVLPYEVISEEFLKSLKLNPIKTIQLWDKCNAILEYIPELLKMKNCKQPKNRHTEGDVWNHTLLGLKKLYSSEFKKEFNEQPDIELIMSILFHDIGKPYTIQIPEKNNTNKIYFDEHDIIGEEITKQILKKIKTSAPSKINVHTANVAWLVRNHMIIAHGKLDELNTKTIEKYFFNPNKPSKNLLKLILIDGLSTINNKGESLTDLFYKLKNRIIQIKKITGSKGNRLVKPLITGKDVMKELNIKPSKKVGKILQNIRQKQLDGKLKSKKTALNYLKNYENHSTTK